MKSNIFLLLVFSTSVSIASNNDSWQMTKDYFSKTCPNSSQQLCDHINKQEQNKKSPVGVIGGIGALVVLGKTLYDVGHGVYGAANSAVSLAHKGTDLLSDGTKAYNKEAERLANEKLKEEVDKLNEWKQKEQEKIDKEHLFLDEKRQGCLQHHAQIINEFGDLLNAKSAVSSLSYSQLQMLSASEIMSGSGKTYFTDLFNKETKRYTEQIKKSQTNEVKDVMKFLSQNKNNNSQSPHGSREGSRSSSPLRNPSNI
jgi:hypothetical protein